MFAGTETPRKEEGVLKIKPTCYMLSSQLVPQRSCAHFGGSFKHLFNTYLLSPSLNQTADTAVMKKEENPALQELAVPLHKE